MPSVRALECLVTAAACGSITEAARLLHLSQPAVSHHLVQLEREAGTALLTREVRGVRLTAAGRAALPAAQQAVDAAATVIGRARAVGLGEEGSLRLACGQSLIVLLAPVIGTWHHTRPRVTISVVESISAEHMSGLLDAGEVDVAVMPPPMPERFTVSPVVREEIVLVGPADHRLARREAVSVADLDGERLVHFAPENALSTWLDRALAGAGIVPVTVMRTAVASAAPQLAAAGLGLAVVPISAVAGGIDGIVRPFTPSWTRDITAVTVGDPDSLASRFIADLSAASRSSELREERPSRFLRSGTRS